MSNAIQFLESLGRNPELVGHSTDAYAAKVALLEVDPAQRQALLDCDVEGLCGLLGGREKVLCMITTPDEGSSQEDFEESRHDRVH